MALVIIAERNISGDASKPPLKPSELYAFLCLAGCLAARGERKGLYNALKTNRALLQLDQLPEANIGLLAFAVDEDQDIRLWLEKQSLAVDKRTFGLEGNKAAMELEKQAIERKDWSGIKAMHKLAPNVFGCSIRNNLILTMLSDESADVNFTLQFFEQMLEMNRDWQWRDEHNYYPFVFVSSLLEHPRYRSAILQPNPPNPLFSWMKPFLVSLISLTIDEYQGIREGEPEDGTAFDHSYRRIIHFLLESLQQGNVDMSCREAAFGEAINLLRHFVRFYVNERNDETDPRGATEEIVSLHASLIANFALRGRVPNTMETVSAHSKARKDALDLIQFIFKLDCDYLAKRIILLAESSIKMQANYKSIVKQDAGKGGTQLERYSGQQIAQLTKNEIKRARQTRIPGEDDLLNRLFSDVFLITMFEDTTELWRESYHAFRSSENLGLFLKPLASLSAFGQPKFDSHLLKVKEKHAELPYYNPYREKLKSHIIELTKRLRTLRGSLPQLLLDISDENGIDTSASHNLTSVIYQLTDVIMQANLCPEPDIHKAAQTLVRATFEEAETRQDCFRSLLQCNPTLALEGIEIYLKSFLQVATNLPEANDAAKWMVRSFSDIMDVLCSQTDGLLREGSPHSLADNVAYHSPVRRLLPSIWHLMCQSIAVIFKRTPSWSRILAHAELTAWFRDVLLFASELVEQVEIIRAAAIRGVEEEIGDKVQATILTEIAIPLEEASSWFRMNDIEIVQETRDFFVKGLLAFKGKADLPPSVKERMLKFIDNQSLIEDSTVRSTLLSLQELSRLRHLLDPRAVIEIEDSDEEDDSSVPMSISPTPPREIEPMSANQRNVLDQSSGKVIVKDTQVESAEAKERRRLKQQKLAFQVLESSTPRPFISKPAPLPPRPQFASSHVPANRYSGAATKSSGTSKFASSAFAEAKRNFKATQVWNKNSHHNLNKSNYTSNSRELPEPEAPAAKRSFADVPRDQVINQQSIVEHTESSESESDEERIGLADLVGQKKSPIKMRPKPRVVSSDEKKASNFLRRGKIMILTSKSPISFFSSQPQKPPARRTVMLEDLEEKRRERERAEAERKRKLRERPNLRPLHRSILSWPYYAEGARPPVPANTPALKYEAVKNTYSNPQSYMNLFEPLLCLEAWGQFQSAKAEVGRAGSIHSAGTITVSGRSFTDNFVVLNVKLRIQRQKEQRFNERFNEADVVYIRETGVTMASPKCILAKVDTFKFDPSRKEDTLNLRCFLQHDTQGMSSTLTVGATLEMGKLFTLTTLHREYEALQVMQYYNLLPSILMARCAVRETLSESEIRQAEADYGVNQPQAEAILGSLKAEQGFNLIQGPPGTGKTKTICSLVAHFIQTRQAPAVAVRPGQVGTGIGVKKKILLCAPSNAAVDEVARRVHEGVTLKNGRTIKPVVVRLGKEEAMNNSVKNFSLESRVERKMASTSSYGSSQPDEANDFVKMQTEIRRLKDERDAKLAELENARLTKMNEKVITQLDAQVRSITVRRNDLRGRLDEVKDKTQTVYRQQTADRKRIELDVLAEADVVCSTLGGAGHNLLCDLPFDFETVVIDEAAQAVEMDTLIPLRYGCQRCILVGDPNQLPPTVISQEAEKLQYSRSLFVRLFDNPANHSNLLSIQYRMHPTISKFPSVEFYGGKLIDGPGMTRLTAKPYHRDTLLAPFRFFNCKGGKEVSGKGMSLINREEANMAAAIYERLRKEAVCSGNLSVDGKVGVISMYKEQIFELRRAFEKIYGQGIDSVVDFNTVDGFQGQEKDTIILSCVRTDGIGFLNDFRRVNVAITRAKSNLFIIGNAGNLERAGKDTIWPRLIEMSRKEGCFMDVTTDIFRRPASIPAPKPVTARPTAPNGIVASPSTNGNLATSPITPTPARSPAKRKMSSTFNPLDVMGSNKRPHLNGGNSSTTNKANGVSERSTASAQSSTRPPAPPPQARPPGPPPQAPQARPPAIQAPVRPPVRPSVPVRPHPSLTAGIRNRPIPPRPTKPINAVPIHPPGPVANIPRPAPRPAVLYPRPSIRPPVFSSQEGPSEKAKSSLFVKKSIRPNKKK